MHRRGTRNLQRAAIPLLVLALILGLASCGGDGNDTNGQTEGGQSTGPETPAKALATGHRLCRLLGGTKGLSPNFGTSDPAKIAQRFSLEIYVGNFPKQAAKGCLEELKAEALGSG